MMLWPRGWGTVVTTHTPARPHWPFFSLTRPFSHSPSWFPQICLGTHSRLFLLLADESSTTVLPVGSIVGIAVGVLVGLALVAALGCLLLRIRNGRYDDISHKLILSHSCHQPRERLCPDLRFWTGSSRLPNAPWIFPLVPCGSFLTSC